MAYVTCSILSSHSFITVINSPDSARISRTTSILAFPPQNSTVGSGKAMNRVWHRVWVLSRNISTLSRKPNVIVSGKSVLPVIPKRGYGAPPRPVTDLPLKVFVPGAACFILACTLCLISMFPKGVKSEQEQK
ncbi:uncharacterized protein LOC110454864 [Mizuhopecten yessoensis]|uniref:Uncharacterized protein n=1 Tax=Mizuhopecten yessoensis TaxID=6573 RepID=A0A210QEB4_MIZYE|nr:uncharacterized protein LOC110454864 [Mizuhopecten yessoensis]OWF47085.1 hypothetical protein KP79_PYT12572 [Mizuhopecten yessoensis]